MQKLSKFVSSIGHPVLTFPLVLTLLFAKYGAWFELAIVFTLSFFLPFLFFLRLYLTKKISDFDITKREERYRVFGLSLVGMLGSVAYLYFSGSELLLEFLKVLLLALVLVVVNFKIKVSIHVALITMVAIFLSSYYEWSLWIFLIILPVLASRLYLKRHSWVEVCLGLFLPVLFYIDVLL